MFIVTLKFAAQAAAAKDHLSGHQAWLQQGFDQGLCLLAGSLVEPKGGALLLQSQDRAEVEAWLAQDPFVQHQGKIKAVINNARRAEEVVAEYGSLAAFIWSFEPAEDEATPQSRSTSTAAEQLAKALKRRGWQFVGPTTVYAFMQAMGLINDHALGCHSRAQVAQARAALIRPGRAAPAASGETVPA
ncbi:DNA-3-methyladenine glycosylase I [Balneatrix alpica]|uniref:DNA-3-methyladenine glycosylase I n=1 Tax=Balneatrix alpica TaxID=75684 RepID=A0ABV5Z993_9GAMM|nr:DNA-3-methyladenine glycosylase I [Balneatrix alpica]